MYVDCIHTYVVITMCIMHYVMRVITEFSKKNLYKYVPKFACKWRDVGIQLLKATHQHALNVIERNSGNDVEECCKRMIDKWLETDKNAKWIQLIKALKSASVSLITLANEIKESTKGNWFVTDIQGWPGNITISV